MFSPVLPGCPQVSTTGMGGGQHVAKTVLLSNYLSFPLPPPLSWEQQNISISQSGHWPMSYIPDLPLKGELWKAGLFAMTLSPF